jgi:WD40 repeat protein
MEGAGLTCVLVQFDALSPVSENVSLAFGKGVLSLPQRGETALEMFAYGDGGLQQSPVEVFEGHTDAVKEFVWREGGRSEYPTLIFEDKEWMLRLFLPDGSEYQLITWSKDKTLRFWPVDSEIMQVNFQIILQ